MFEIEVKRTISANIDKIFDLISDHANYQKFKAIDQSSVLKQSVIEHNGTGTVRKVSSGSFIVVEEILEFNQPKLMGYKIKQAKPFSMDHQKGIIELEAVDDNTTKVRWYSKGRITTPVIGFLCDKVMQKNGTKAFASILKDIETELSS